MLVEKWSTTITAVLPIRRIYMPSRALHGRFLGMKHVLAA
jgi:hypothetical protein